MPASSFSSSPRPARRSSFGSIGLPPALAYVTIAAEVVGGIALILGVWTRAVAVAVTPILLGAISAVHGSAGFFFTNANGGWEFPAFWTVALSSRRCSATARTRCARRAATIVPANSPAPIHV